MDLSLVALIASFAALLYALVLFLYVRRQDRGNEKMIEINTAVKEGASAFLRREYSVIAPIAIVIFFLIYGLID